MSQIRNMIRGSTAFLLSGMLLLSACPALVSADSGETLSAGQGATATQFMDCFEPMPIVESLSGDSWGAEEVGPRDQGNGLEDRDMSDYSYWDGGIIKDDETGQYYMFASRWDQRGGHEGENGYGGWRSSEAIYAVSDSLYGPYEDQGRLYEDHNGIGHNVFPFELSATDPLREQGYRYAVVVSDAFGGNGINGTIHVAEKLSGPWVMMDNGKGGMLNVDTSRFGLSNISIAVGPDGYIATNRNGDIAKATSVAGEWTVVQDDLWAKGQTKIPDMLTFDGRVEDPVIWYSDGLYHIAVNHWKARFAYYLTSEDGTNWVRHPGTAYTPDADFLRYEDGTVNHWTKLERPNIYVEDGSIKAMTFAVIDVQKADDHANDQHGSKIIVVPFSAEKLQQLDAAPDPLDAREGLMPVGDANIQSWKTEANKNYGAETFLQLQRDLDEADGMGLLGSGEKPRDGYDCKIGFVQYDLPGQLTEGQIVSSAYLSVVYKDLMTDNNVWEDQIQVAVSDTDWQEGSGKESANSNHAGEGDLTWSNQPQLLGTEDAENAVVTSETFNVADKEREIKIDVTELVKEYLEEHPDATTISFALNETGGTRIHIGSKEAGERYAPRLILNTEDAAVPVTGISLDQEKLTLKVGETAVVTATVTPENATNQSVSWCSEDPSIATVDRSGNIAAVAQGDTVIYAVTEDGQFEGKCTVHVEAVPPAVDKTLVKPALDALTEVPTELQSLYPTLEELQNAMQIEAEAALDAESSGTAFYEVELYYTDENGNWLYDENGNRIPVAKEDFPAEGVSVTFAYPQETSKDSHLFAIVHMCEDGSKEIFDGTDITYGADGMTVKVTSLSPFAVTWCKRSAQPEESPANNSGGNTTGDKNTGNSAANQDTAVVGKQPETVPASVSNTVPQTDDKANLWLPLCGSVVSALAMVGLTFLRFRKRSKKN